MIKALVVGNYKNTLIEQSFKPKLLNMGIDLVKYTDPESACRSDLSKYELIVALTDFMSHEQAKKISNRSKHYGMKMFSGTFQTSKWNLDKLRMCVVEKSNVQEEKEMRTYSIDDEDMKEFVDIIYSARKSGERWEDIIPLIDHLWKGKPIPEGMRIRDYLRKCVAYSRDVKAGKETKSKVTQILKDVFYEPGEEPREEPKQEVKEEKNTHGTEQRKENEDDVNFLKGMVKIYEEENEKLKKDVKNLEQTVKTLNEGKNGDKYQAKMNSVASVIKIIMTMLDSDVFEKKDVESMVKKIESILKSLREPG